MRILSLIAWAEARCKAITLHVLTSDKAEMGDAGTVHYSVGTYFEQGLSKMPVAHGIIRGTICICRLLAYLVRITACYSFVTDQSRSEGFVSGSIVLITLAARCR